MQTIITTIAVILAVSVIITVLSIYNIISITSEELVYEQASEINKQIVFNYENYTNRVENITNLLQKKVFEYDILTQVDQLTDVLMTTEELEDSIVAVTIFDNIGEFLVGTHQLAVDSNDIVYKEWYKNAVYDDTIIHFTSQYEQDIYEGLNQEVISVSKVFEYKDHGLIKKGVLLVDMSFEELDALFNFTNLGPMGHILILDDENQILYASDRSVYDYESRSYEVAKEQIFGSTQASINGIEMVININTVSSTRWRIATFQDVNRIESGMESALFISVLLIAITMIITILVAYLVAKQITNPLKNLSKAMKRFHNGNYDSKVDIEGQKEITIVTTGFNEMIDKIQDLMNEVVNEQEGKRKTEIRALQNQINPHFLYNTLDCLIWLAEEKRNEDLVETVSALSTYFRVSLSKGKQFIPIYDELKHIESYMLIQRLRYNDVFDYSIECAPTVSELKIMKLILQPLVENAIYHGVDKDDRESFIKIKVLKDETNIILSVMNSGYGISEAKIKEINREMVEGNTKGSVGMMNVYKRIKLFYGEKAFINIESELDESTTISIVIPRDAIE